MPTMPISNLALSFIAPPGGGLNGNQRDVGSALVNYFNNTGGIPLVFGGLTAAGLTQISGETAVGSQQTTFDAMTQFMDVMTDPHTAGRGFDAGAGATLFAEEGFRLSLDASPDRSRSRNERDAYAAIYRKTPIRDAYDPRWSVWAAGFGGSQTTEGNAALGSNTATSRVFGVAIGRRLPAVAAHHRRLRARRRRHQLQRRQWRLRAIRLVPGWRLHQAHMSARPTSPPPPPMAGRTSPPIAP